MILETIKGPEDLQALDIDGLHILAEEMRSALIRKISLCGGHLASNLGVVELTIALHYVFQSPVDKIVFDVSHQSYCHKMLTGRSKAFLDSNYYDAVSGFSNPDESLHDFFHIGHTSTSVSLACGLAKARDLTGGDYNVVAVIGDGALDGGQAFEGLNFGAELPSGLIVVVNDNDMSLAENCGGLYRNLAALRDCEGKAEHNYFKALGFTYHYVPDGNDLDLLISELRSVRGTNCPTVVHVVTKKGKGYIFAEQNREKWHWARPFDVMRGEFLASGTKENYGDIVGDFLLQKIRADPTVAVVAAGTPVCIGFHAGRRSLAGRQYIDVGIAEQNAVTISAAIARGGGKPIFATNSTFLQRAYDQIQQELCLNKCSATIIVTHASVYGHTNITHLGLFDIPLLSHIPNLVYLAPTNHEEYLSMLDWSIEQGNCPVAIRVPWTGVTHTKQPVETSYETVRYQVTLAGERAAILALGGFYSLGEQVVRFVREKAGISCTLVNPRFITGVDSQTLETLKQNHELVLTLEDGIISGGFGSKIAQYYAMSNMRVLVRGISTPLPVRYEPQQFIRDNRLTAEQIAQDLVSAIS